MPADADTPIEILGRYAVCASIGSGGMATVHVGRLLGPVGFSRTVAIKRMHSHLASDPEFVTMFLDEARIAARVQHTNVVATLDVVTEGGQLFHVMEYVPGESLAKILLAIGRANIRLPHNVIGAILSQALHGLHAVHECKGEDGRLLGLIHRDVSPDNILVGRDGSARVLDFGIAKATEHGRRTQAGKVKGKVAYMSPEHLRGKDIDRRADIYAAGAILWEMLTGRRLIAGETDIEMVHSAINFEPVPPSKIVPGLPRILDSVVMMSLAVEREGRYQTARDMAIAIEETLGVASPTVVAELVEGVMGKELARKAALVDSAVKRAAQVTDAYRSQINSVVATPPGGRKPIKTGMKALGERVPAPASESPFRVAHAETVAYSGGAGPGASKSAETLPDGSHHMRGTEVMAMPDLVAATKSPDPKVPSLELGDLGPAPAQPVAPDRPATGTALNPSLGDLSLDLPSAPHPAARPQPAPKLAPAAAAPAPPPSEPQGSLSGALDVDFGARAAPSSGQRPRPSGHGHGPGGAGPGMGPQGPSPLMRPAYGGGAMYGGGVRVEKSSGLSMAIVAPLLVGLIIIGAVVFFVVSRKESGTASANNAELPPPSQAEVGSCETLRKKIRQGGQATGLSRSGWTVELWLRGPGGKKLEAVNVDASSLLAKADDPVTTTRLSAPGKTFDEGIVVQMRGATAEGAFDADGVTRLIKAADAIFDKTGAEAGALYMKCSHLPHHDLGIWFRGRDLTFATSSLLFSMGMFSDLAFVKEEPLYAADMRADMTVFERIRARLTGKPSKSIGEELERYNATVTELPGNGGVRLTFPSDHLESATRASRVVADRGGLEKPLTP